MEYFINTKVHYFNKYTEYTVVMKETVLDLRK